jgi:hypothetical protein
VPTAERVALLTYSTKPRGGVVHTLAPAEALAERGVDVTVWSLGRGGDRAFFRPVDPRVAVRLVPLPEIEGETVGERVVRSIAGRRRARRGRRGTCWPWAGSSRARAASRCWRRTRCCGGSTRTWRWSSRAGRRSSTTAPTARGGRPGPPRSASGRWCSVPSTKEGFGLAALEALAAGVPLVVSDLPVLRETFGGAAESAHDPLALAAALDRALTAPDPARRAAGRVLAARRTWSEAANRHLDFYRSLPAGGHR